MSSNEFEKLTILGAEMEIKRSITVGHVTQVAFVRCESVTINGVEYGGYFRIEKYAARDALHLDLGGMWRSGMAGRGGLTDGARNKLTKAFKDEVFPNVPLPTHEELTESLRAEYISAGRSMGADLLCKARMSQYGHERERLGYLNEFDVRDALIQGFKEHMSNEGIEL